MSAFICSDKHIASVVCAIYPEEQRQAVADEIKKQNIRSVNYRYNERTKVTPCDLTQAVPLRPVDVCSLAHSLEYQCCERPDWTKSKAYQFLLKIVFSAAPIEGGAWSI